MKARGLTSLLAVSGLLSCGSSDETRSDAGGASAPCTAAQALQTTTSQGGSYTVYVCDSMAPALGFNAFAFLVVDRNGQPQNGLSLSVQPWMPYMNHGSPGTPTVTSGGDGQYQIANVIFQMAGEWQLRTTISAPTADSADPQFNID